MKKELTAIQKLQDIIAQYAIDNALMVECIVSLMVIVQEHSDMNNPEVRQGVAKALLILGENPADAD